MRDRTLDEHINLLIPNKGLSSRSRLFTYWSYESCGPNTMMAPNFLTILSLGLLHIHESHKSQPFAAENPCGFHGFWSTAHLEEGSSSQRSVRGSQKDANKSWKILTPLAEFFFLAGDLGKNVTRGVTFQMCCNITFFWSLQISEGPP